jgi:beta-fructofuranosidase
MMNTTVALLLLAIAVGVGTDVCTKGPCGPGNERCVGHKPQQYVYHLSDETCETNDPNGPFYDEVHGVYHLFYQDHIAQPQPLTGPGHGPDWGHWVSKDFLHWARLPVAIWNDQWYDAVAIYSGSTTIVDGKPVIVYPGLCNRKHCPHGSTYNVAVPADPSDPLYTNWTKPSHNPIVQATGDDPSTAWKTKDGEWRLIGNQGGGAGAPIYGSMDFKSWYKIGFTTLRLGDCPTLFPLPALTPGSAEGLSDAEVAALPSHVHKAGSGKPPSDHPYDPADQVQVGTWTDGKPGPAAKGGTPGTWVQKLPGSTPLDAGKTHASKDFYDPITKRRIMWVWGQTKPLGPPGSGGFQTIPREVTYDPRTNRINYAPAEEMKQLRRSAASSRLQHWPLPRSPRAWPSP